MIRASEAYDSLLDLLEREIYQDNIETIVEALLIIDQEKFLKNLKSYKREVKKLLLA